jgi:hypothetical protein
MTLKLIVFAIAPLLGAVQAEMHPLLHVGGMCRFVKYENTHVVVSAYGC